MTASGKEVVGERLSEKEKRLVNTDNSVAIVVGQGYKGDKR